MHCVAVLTISLLALTAAGKDSVRCPFAIGKNPFDDSKFAGQWHVITGVSPASNEIKKCAKVDISYPRTDVEKTMSMKFSYKINDQIQHAEIYSEPFKPEKPAISYSVYRKNNEKWTDVYKLTVIAADYDNYAIILACQPVFNATAMTFGRSLYADIWSRTATMDPTTLQVLKNIISGYDVNIEDMKDMSHEGC